MKKLTIDITEGTYSDLFSLSYEDGANEVEIEVDEMALSELLVHLPYFQELLGGRGVSVDVKDLVTLAFLDEDGVRITPSSSRLDFIQMDNVGLISMAMVGKESPEDFWQYDISLSHFLNQGN